MKNKPVGRPQKYKSSTRRTIRFPDELWNEIPGVKSNFVIRAVEEKLSSESILSELAKWSEGHWTDIRPSALQMKIDELQQKQKNQDGRG